MLINKPPVIAGQLDRCDVCGNKMHRDKLVRTQVEWLYPAHNNYFTYSNYDGTVWVCDATDVSTISYGNRCDYARTTLDDSNTITILNGVQTWSGDGTFRCTTAPTTGAGSTDNVIFSCQIGPWERSTTPELTVAIGDCDTDGNNKTAKANFTVAGASRICFSWTGLEASAGQGCYYIQVTNDGYWWIDELQLEVSSSYSTPGVYVKTSGSTISQSTDLGAISSRKVCPECFETVLKKSEQYGRPDESPIDLPVETYNQEF